MNGETMAVTGEERKPFGLIIILAGLATSAITLGIVYAMAQVEFFVMGFYLNYIIPIGALAAGFASGSGYALATWRKGVKVTSSVCWLIVLLSFASYFTAQYIEYSQLSPQYEDGTAVGFWEYFDVATRSFAWSKRGGETGEPLGAWGYGLRALEVGGFVFGGLLGALILKAAPYCEPCSLYMRTRRLGLLPASAPARKIRKGDQQGQQEYDAQQNQAFASAQATVESLAEAGTTEDDHAFNGVLASARTITEKQAIKLPLAWRLKLVYCPQCATGRLVVEAVERQKKEVKTSEAARFDLAPALVAKLQNLQPQPARAMTGQTG